MSENNFPKINLSRGAIKYLESKKVNKNTKISLDVDYIFQIEKITKNSGKIYNCTMMDNDSKYGGFLLSYEAKDGTPTMGDIIQVSKIIIAVLPSRSSHIYYCENINLLYKGLKLQVEPNKLLNISKHKSKENHIYDINKYPLNENSNNNSNNDDDKYCDEFKYVLISSLNSFTSYACFYLKCKLKIQKQFFISKATNKEIFIQSYIFMDIKGDEIHAECFNKMVDYFSNIIFEGSVYEIKNASIQFADKSYNKTKCDFRLVFNEQTQIKQVNDNGKFQNPKLNITPLNKIKDLPVGKLVDVFGFVIENKGTQEFKTRYEKIVTNQKLLIGDDSSEQIMLVLWEPFINNENNFSFGDLILVKNCRIREYKGNKELNVIDSSEIKRTLDPQRDNKLKKFFEENKNCYIYKDNKGDLISFDKKDSPEFVFIKDILNIFDIDDDIQERPSYEINATVYKLNHSNKNYYKGCVNCHKKMDIDICLNCSGMEQKTLFSFPINVRDSTSFLKIDLFGDMAEQFFGIKADEYEAIIENEQNLENNEKIKEINQRIEYHTFSFVGKIKKSSYDIKKRRFSVYKFSEITNEKREGLCKMLNNVLK